jgi:hypothetical protein
MDEFLGFRLLNPWLCLINKVTLVTSTTNFLASYETSASGLSSLPLENQTGDKCSIRKPGQK